jgi:hypothetical protein
VILRCFSRRSLFLFVVACAGTGWAAAPLSATNTADYEIEVALDPETHRLTAAQKIRWTNRSGAATDEIYLHLYLNAFSGPRTTFMREFQRLSYGNPKLPSGDWGWIRIGRLTFHDGSDLLPAMEFVRPDDGNPDDHTLARVELPRVVEPGGVIDLELEFEAQLPRAVSRTGFVEGFHLVAQWFPKIAVFSGENGWNDHQFHASSEFFADFGEYLVTITVPEDWVLGATGIEVRRSVPAAGRQTVVFRAQRVHDFAWSTAPSDLMEVVETEFEPARDVPMAWLERAQSLLGIGAAELELPPTHLRLLVPREQRDMTVRMVRATRLAIAWYGLFYGAFPYPQLTVVWPPPGAKEAGGMEYPTFITSGADRLDAYPPFSMSWDLEALTVHEFGHQYFQSLLASNEFEEAWLDEGLTSYTEISCMEAIAADDLVPEIGDFDYWASERMALSTSKLPMTVGRKAWDYRHHRSYYLASYTKTAILMHTLEGLIGREAMARGLRSYFERYRFGHPTGSDLFEALGEAAGQDLGWFFDQAVDGDAVADWAVLSVRHRRPPAAGGHRWNGTEWVEIDDDSAPEGAEVDGWVVDLQLARRGEFVGPVEVELTWSDGTTERRTWNDKERWVTWQFEGPNRLEQVVVDPDIVWALETRRADNYWRARPAGFDHPLWWLRGSFELARHLFLRFY